MIDRIERYRLHEFDHLKPHEVEDKLRELYPGYRISSDEFLVKAEVPSVVEEKTIVAVVEPKKEEHVKILTKQEILDALTIQTHPNGGLKYVVLGGDLDLTSLSENYKINESRLMTYNELRTKKLKKNQIIFLEYKNSEGNQDFYTAQKGDKMYEISQKFGIKLRKLYTKNRMEEGREPREGQVIYLKTKKPRRA